MSQVRHASSHRNNHVLLFLVLELLAEVQQSMHDVADNDRQLHVSLLEVRCHDLKEVRRDDLLEGELLVSQLDDVAEDVSYLLADVERSFIVEQFDQLFSYDLLAEDEGGRALIGAEVGQDPAGVLAEDRVRTLHEFEDAVQEVALEQGVGVVLHFLAQHIAEDPQGQLLYLQILRFQPIQQALHHFLLVEEPGDGLMPRGVRKLIQSPKGHLRSLDNKGKQRLIGDLIEEDVVEQHPDIRDVSFSYGKDILFLADYVISCCDQSHRADVVRCREVEFQVALELLCEGGEVGILLLLGHAEDVKGFVGHMRIEFC